MLTNAERIKLKVTIAASLLAADCDDWLEDTRYLAVASEEILKNIEATETGGLTRELLNKEEAEAAETGAGNAGEDDGNNNTRL